MVDRYTVDYYKNRQTFGQFTIQQMVTRICHSEVVDLSAKLLYRE